MTAVRQGGTIRAINAVGRVASGLGLRARLDADSLLDAASARTGLDDFGSPDFREGLDVLTGSLEHEAQLTPLGRVAARTRLLGLLENRLRLVERHHDPAVRAEVLSRPVFVLGLPRTGTTVLYGMLAANPAMRAPASWEVARPFPAPAGEDPARVAAMDKDLAGFRRLAPGIDHIHPLGARLPQERLAMHALEMTSYEFPTTYPVPGYWAWLRERDLRGAYELEKRLLQHLQSGGHRGAHWILKTPCHLMWLDVLLEVFPDALLVHTHRDPATVLASVSSLMTTMRSAVSARVDLVTVGREQLDAWTWGMERVMAVRERLPADRVVDVQYADTVADPVGTVRRVYEHFGLDYTDEVAGGVRRYLVANPRDKHGTHTYSLADFGLAAGEVEAAFAGYNDRFGVRP
ncbi:MAG: sulfotransferase [Actinomycetota bacterium]|nr:sulfotransferase [Actinomycetota bacterium]